MSIDKKRIGGILIAFGADPRKMYSSIKYLFRYLKGYKKFKQSVRKNDFKIKIYPILSDYDQKGGVSKGHYFHQDLWAARKIYADKPIKHIDIGSRVDGFIAHLLTFMDVLILDVRSVESNIKGLSYAEYDLMNPKIKYKSKSVSSLHVIEHIGLGRYGDEIDYDGWRMAIKNISEIVESSGTLYLSVPVGLQRVEYNAHRVFMPDSIVDEAKKNSLYLKEYSYVDDDGMLHENAKMKDSEKCYYGCGCFVFEKKEK